MAESAGGIRAGRAYVELGVKDTIGAGLAKALARLRAFAAAVTAIGKGLRKVGDVVAAVGAQLNSLGRTLLAVGAAALAPLALLAKLFDNVGSAIYDMSLRTGFGTDALQELAFGAEQTGSSIEELENGLKSMQRFLVTTAKGSREARKSLSLLGLAIEDLSTLRPEDQLALIADRLAQVQDPAVRAGLAMEIFGKSGTKLLPMLKDGSAGLRALAREARDAGIILSNEDVVAADEFGDALAKAWKQVKAVGVQIGAVIAKALLPYKERITEVIASIIDWIKQNQGFVVSLVKLTAIFGASATAMGASLVVLGTSLKIIAPLFQVAGIAIQATGAILSALLTPIGAVSAALVAAAAIYFYYSEQGAKALDYLKGVFDDLRDIATETFAGIADALATGDILTAARILWLGLKTAWLRGVQSLREVWAKFWLWTQQYVIAVAFRTVELLEKSFHGIEVAWIETTAFIERAWDNTVAFIGGVWDAFINGFKDAWSEAARFLMKSWNSLKGAFDDTFDVDAANKKVDEQTDTEKGKRVQDEIEAATKREQARQKALEDAERKRRQRRIDEDAKHKAILQRIADAEIALSKAASEGAAEDIAKAAAELDAAKRDLETARQNAAEERKRQSDERNDRTPPTQDAPPGTEDDDAANLTNIGRGQGSVQFGGQLLEQMGGRALSAQQETAKNTKRGADLLSTIAHDKAFNDERRARERAAGAGLPDFSPKPKPPPPGSEKEINERARARERAAGVGFFSDRVNGMFGSLPQKIPAAMSQAGNLFGTGSPATPGKAGIDVDFGKLVQLMATSLQIQTRTERNTRGTGYAA